MKSIYKLNIIFKYDAPIFFLAFNCFQRLAMAEKTSYLTWLDHAPGNDCVCKGAVRVRVQKAAQDK
jgi:hypothetical protein